MKRAVLIFRAKLHHNFTRPGVPLFHVAKALVHSSQETTRRHYVHLAPGETKEMPNILERYVFGIRAGNHVNGRKQRGSPPRPRKLVVRK